MLELAETEDRLPKVLVVVHLGGISCDMARINRLSKDFGFSIIEDASHALGGKYKNSQIGDCHYSDVTVFSFHPVKSITTGEGGVAITNSAELASRMRLLRSHGITKSKDEFEFWSEDPWYYEQQILGLNYRMSDISAALGISQLQRLDDSVSTRNDIAQCYLDGLQGLGLQFQSVPSNCISAYHLFICRADFDGIQKTRRQLFEYMFSQGILFGVHYIPIYKHPYYRDKSRRFTHFQNANTYYEQAFSIPIFVDLSLDEQFHVIHSLRQFMES
jgi:dTDP-4-amino-4,6-dideoxygalactose transaminase